MTLAQQSQDLSRPAGGVDNDLGVARKAFLAQLGDAVERGGAVLLERRDLGYVLQVGAVVVVLRIAENRMAAAADVEDEDLLRDFQQRQVIEIQIMEGRAPGEFR